ncbi:MAG: antibiotic biosynthesis monooxygenase [Pseudomonas sp.]|jgi:antibiotic biosynthesis monooxygenase (ABM) superfamily enzyme|uniref:antibiotic biosynthesis monooxygenase n=1 Tax=Pseudomonas sp. TaxID=306 RepID=UPI00239ADE1A|nr:antibiotic biosynthesis monooxygenase [Pseudomonas sp.]MDP9031913.1 antibiotic biosynthesis monooxygenase [Pseudomonadota bacterium]MDE1911986.1 antibiotic biosynthesis monooxygenase [Pseudomonas sp.]MDE2189876.1 antibiotic biosynthesis monooxygenase [Pseudomonas sp.]MDE2559505.1 antibiotic biosynthesis monooxygenase [Pseudomonas sp.]MDP9062661.1 antibiotic biosynthesis monooxygenase [Pseudomonadota bacterium]
MSTSPVTLMVARRVAKGRYEELMAWLREGEQLATDFPGYLGSGVLAPPPNDDEFQIIFRFADEKTLHAWEFSASRGAWLGRGSELFAAPSEHRVRGIDGWFGAAAARPPRWKQAVAIWLAFFPVSLLFNFGLEPLLSELGLLSRVLVSTLALTPLMVYFFIPLSTHLLAGWLHPAPARVTATEAAA